MTDGLEFVRWRNRDIDACIAALYAWRMYGAHYSITTPFHEHMQEVAKLLAAQANARPSGIPDGLVRAMSVAIQAASLAPRSAAEFYVKYGQEQLEKLNQPGAAG